MAGGRTVPIGAYGMVGDTRTAALVAPDGSVDWLCAPRFDSPPLFGRLVGGPDGGSFRLAPAGRVLATRRRYLPGTATLVTTWAVDGAELELADALVADVEGRLLPGTLLVRRVTCRGGPARLDVVMEPRFGYRQRRAARVRRSAGALVWEAGDLAVAVTTNRSDLALDRPAEIELGPGESVTVVLAVSSREPLVVVPPGSALEVLAGDENRWRLWCSGLHVPLGLDVVERSLMTLRMLTYSPSGAPVAAPTTSLPELVGGVRNWDYRYAWPRDASIGIAAFLDARRDEEARAFLAWLLHASRLTRPRLPVLFTVHGQPGPRENLLPWAGYAGSRPVRRGNAASTQHQLDGYGWVIDAAWLLAATGHGLYAETWRTLRGMADHVAGSWQLPDAGIWEKRGEPRQHVHSKLMAWVALDRALRIGDARGERGGRRAAGWRHQREALAADVRRHGFDERLGAYTAGYGTTDLDAALLLLPRFGFDPPTGSRVRGTVAAIRRELGAGGPLVHRYLPGTDGLEGGEGAFLPCSFWLVEALARTGRRDQAAGVFEQVCGLGGVLGLFGEEMDPATREHLGNYPQALTHSSLVQAAAALAGG